VAVTIKMLDRFGANQTTGTGDKNNFSLHVRP
jgi:hypothetical protein